MPSRRATTGKTLAKLRFDKGLVQEEVASRVGISRSHLSNLENDRTKPSNGVLTKLIKVLQIKDEVVMHLLLAGSSGRPRRGPMRPRPRPYH